MTEKLPITPKRFRELLHQYLDITWKDARRGQIPDWVRGDRKWMGTLQASHRRGATNLPFSDAEVAEHGPNLVAAFERIKGVRGVEEILKSLAGAAPKDELAIVDDPFAGTGAGHSGDLAANLEAAARKAGGTDHSLVNHVREMLVMDGVRRLASTTDGAKATK